MTAIGRFFTNRWVLAAFGLSAIALVIWFLGPYLGFGDTRPLESVLVRIVTILLTVVTWLIVVLVKALRSQRASEDLAEGIAEQAGSNQASAVQREEEVGQLRKQFDEALLLLKKSRGKRGRVNLYELPWYIIVGPPGSGKTTVLSNSGLHFPLAEKFGDRALRGIGGTRNCDWWFTDDAILLDTAGRYVTQDSDEETDRLEWHSFLDLLKKHRRRRPINGVMVAISVGDILLMSADERARQVSSLRQRIQELYEHFGVRVPVYVMLTKSDLLAGFSEFFEDLSREEREQVWGMTFPVIEEDATDPLVNFDQEFDRLIERLNERVLERVDRERDYLRRGLVYDFPAQLANIKELLASFLTDVFVGSRFEITPYVRGVYFTSGTQEGAPIDRLLANVSRGFGIDIESLPTFRGQGRSYFVHRLLKDVLFKEAELAGTNRNVERRRAMALAGVVVSVLVVSSLVIFGWLASYFNNTSLIEQAATQAQSAEAALGEIRPASQLLDQVIPALNQVRDLPGGYAQKDADVPLSRSLGLDQGDKLGSRAQSKYRQLLVRQLLPRLMLDLEDQLVRGGATSDFRYEALKRYLMLDSKDHYESAPIIGWFREVWSQDYARSLSNEQLEDLFGHLQALFETRPEPLPLPLDDGLIARTRQDLLRIPLEERVYGRIKRASTEDLRGFSIAAAAGADAGVVFVRKSGNTLLDEAPALYTRDGYRNVFLPGLARVSASLLEESWVLGQTSEVGGSVASVQITERVRDLYFRDYVSVYEDLLLDLDLAPFGTPAQAATILRLLSADDSPLIKLVAAVREETQLEDSPVDAAKVGEAADKVMEQQRELAGILGRTSVGSGINRAVQNLSIVQNRFGRFNELVPEEGDGPLTRILEVLQELYEFMNLVARQADNLPAHMAESGENSIQRLLNEVAGKPAFLEALMGSAASQTSKVAFGGVANNINSEWNARAGGYCRNAIAERYPLVRNSSSEIQLQDFSEFFGDGGIMESFFADYLADYVDTARRPWRVKESRASTFRLNTEALRQFERAQAIREVFFKGGGSTPAVTFELTPLRLDTTLDEFSLELGGKQIVYRSGPKLPEIMSWPGVDAASIVRLRMLPPGPSGRSVVEERGPWAWFRLLDRAVIEPTANPESFNVTFTLDGRAARYELAARSAFNPFSLPELNAFRCPTNL